MRIGIIGAMRVEMETIHARMKNVKTEEYARMKFYIGEIGTHEVILVQSGVGKVNAAMAAQMIAGHYHVDALINTGVAGALDHQLKVLDFVVSQDAQYGDVDATVFGYAYGEVPQMGIVQFPADKRLITKLTETISRIVGQERVHTGRVISQDRFISTTEDKQFLATTLQGTCCEMEGAAIAHVAYRFQTPYVILRAISDQADGSDLMQYDEFEERAAKLSAQIVLEALEENWNF